MTDPTNLLPTDPVWVRLVDAHNEAAAKELGCMVITIAIQEHGKLGVSIAGVPESGVLTEMAKDVPGMLLDLAAVIKLQDQHQRANGGH